MLMYLAIATIISVVITIIGGALLSAAEKHEFLGPLACTLLTLGAGITVVLAIIWLARLT